MFLARVIGSVVATKKDESMKGRKLLLLRPLLVDEAQPDRFRSGQNTIVAVDSHGAGKDEIVLFCQGSSARQATGMKQLPVDAAVIGIVDRIEVLGKSTYCAGDDTASAQSASPTNVKSTAPAKKTSRSQTK
ncbi:MAG: EutN/CcmL family microcompartment protein [Opitutales bacterium]|nr:EutN/CcmL family microcompartment protein [Opitutales bacterium]